ncbi:MAG: hypothetical protein KDA92_02940, partial [Planctomycetales bacterium]|nr:hypothetical protein [Planctomycetales bacterium]
TVVEELLDVIVEQGVANLGHLRDAISRNDIKLPDLGGATELIHGDLLLLADRQLAHELAGLYRPGAIYLRSAQRLSSIAFGTRTGRFITRYAALPFGGAYLAMEGVRHLIDFLAGRSHFGPNQSHRLAGLAGHLPPAAEHHILPIELIPVPATSHAEMLAVLALGTFLLLVMHVPRFRAWCQLRAQLIWYLIRTYIVAAPVRIFNSPIVQEFLRSTFYTALRSYVIWPAIVTAVFRLVGPRPPAETALHWSIEIFLATALFLNSRIGRYVDERVADLLLRTWQEVRMRVFSALFEWIMDTFRRVFAYLERLVYTVDEWLRFRAGDNRVTQAVKLLSGVCWSFIAYFVILVFTLLIEPQINPIKHFPVVTVSHKLILPTGPAIIKTIAPFTGSVRAPTIVWSTIWLIPGVFGFLVWELKANWRLYEANRPRRLMPTPVGHHGETMLRLLRPGFHSGTLPKSFAALRHALKAAQDNQLPSVERKLAVLRHVEESILRFVNRKLLLIWSESTSADALAASISKLHIATSSIDVHIAMQDRPQNTIELTWQDVDNRFVMRASAGDWLEQLDKNSRESCVVGLTGLAQFSAAEVFQLDPDHLHISPLDWRAWQTFWAARAREHVKVHENFTESKPDSAADEL